MSGISCGKPVPPNSIRARILKARAAGRGLLVLAVAFSGVACGKLKVSRLKANYYFAEGNKFFKDGKFRDAISEYEKALKLNPELGQAQRFLGESYKSLFKVGSETRENMEKAEKAIEAFNRALELEPDNKETCTTNSADSRTPRSSI